MYVVRHKGSLGRCSASAIVRNKQPLKTTSSTLFLDELKYSCSYQDLTSKLPPSQVNFIASTRDFKVALP